MPKFQKTIEAVQFRLKKKQIDGIAAKQLVTDDFGIEYKKNGEDYFGLVAINGSVEKVNEGDWLEIENGAVVKIYTDESFKANYKAEVEETKAPAKKK